MIFHQSKRFNSLISSSLRYMFANLKFPLPDLGEKIKEGTIKKMYVREGERVEEFQKIADVESDKQFTEITSPQKGLISKLYYKQTEVCKVGDLFMEIDIDGGHKNSAKQQKVQTTINIEEKIVSVDASEQILTSPAVRSIARLHKIDLTIVKGTGKKGRILKEDLLNLLQNVQTLVKAPAKQNIVHTPSKIKEKPILKPQSIKFTQFQLKRIHSSTMSNDIPHLFYHESFNFTDLDHILKGLKHKSINISLNSFLLKTLSLAMTVHPRLNSTYSKSHPFQFQTYLSHNIGLGIEGKDGMVTPVLKNVQNLSLRKVQSAVDDFKERAHANKLKDNDFEDSTISLYNLGAIAGLSSCPLIPAPQSCIISVGRVAEHAFFVGSSIHSKKEFTVTFACDHRVIDGASVARFSNHWKGYIEHPYLALIDLS